ncbi:MAG: LysM domain/M23/M37 peptidase domain-containing protein [Spirochaetes bacterium]|nr:MAG: LysM domain/M23/M37 peptidase domain-containing protein [Spirochaetota bacterium]
MKHRTLIRFGFLLVFLIAGKVYAADQVHHILGSGETLYSVSRMYKIPSEALAAANGITDPTKLKLGTVLVIPTIHVVEKGETLYGISRKFGITVNELLRANRLKSDYILKIGDTLVIPANQSPASQPSAPPVPSGAPAAPTAAVAAPSPANPAPTEIGSGQSSVFPPPPKQNAPNIPMPDPVKTQEKVVDQKLLWPVDGKAMYLDGKLEGILIRPKAGEIAKAIAAGTVVSAGPSRGFSQVVFVQSKAGYVYVYGGNESLMVKTGDLVKSGQELGKIGIDPKDAAPVAFFFVFRNGQPIDPATAPRD